jgi:hypothetical protein
VTVAEVAYPTTFGVTARSRRLREYVEEAMGPAPDAAAAGGEGAAPIMYVFEQLKADSPLLGDMRWTDAVSRGLIEGMASEFYIGPAMSGAQVHRHGAAVCRGTPVARMRPFVGLFAYTLSELSNVSTSVCFDQVNALFAGVKHWFLFPPTSMDWVPRGLEPMGPEHIFESQIVWRF